MAQIGDNYIGVYRRLKMLRQGKTCQIWEAMRDIDQTRCVLKILRDDFRQDRGELGMLKHEYTVAKELHHQNCIQIFEFDIIRGVPFLALEHFDSLNLKQWIREPGAQRDWLPNIIAHASEGIEHLHQQGWIHCDLKPDNLLVNSDVQVKLIDFAITQRPRRGLGGWWRGKGKVQGTRSYMSPEQIRSEPLDGRSDLYSFGCVVYELVSGKPPFTGTSGDELLQRHLKSPVPSLLAFSDSVSEEFAALVARTMAKRREQRPGSVNEFLALFRQISVPFRRRR